MKTGAGLSALLFRVICLGFSVLLLVLTLLGQIRQALRQDGFLCVEEAAAMDMEPLFAEAGFRCCRSERLPDAARWMLQADASEEA